MHRLLHQPLVLGVERAGRLVEQQDRRVADQGAGDHQPLALTPGEGAGPLADRGLEALRQSREEVGGLSGGGGGLQRLGVGLGVAEADVVGSRAGEQGGVLGHQGQPLAHLAGVGLAQVNAVDRHLALHRIVEAQQQAEDRALAGAGGTHQGDPLAPAHLQREAIQRQLVLAARIGEGDVGELDLAPGGLGHGTAAGRGCDRRAPGHQLGNSIERAGRFLDLAPDLAQFARR